MRNKILSLILILLMVPTILAPVLAKADIALQGDLNGDGLVNDLDKQIIQKEIAGQEAPNPAADFDGDGAVSPSDLVTEKLLIAHNSNSQPAAPTIDPNATVNPGDPNNDGKQDYKDLGLLQEMVAGQIQPNSSADLDGDGVISPSDILQLKLNIAHASLGSFGSASAGSTPTISNSTQSAQPATAADQTANTGDPAVAQPQPETAVSAPATQAASENSFTYPANPHCIGKMGDLNGDGLVNDLDIEIAKKMIAGVETSNACADFDQDGYVSPSDLVNFKLVINSPYFAGFTGVTEDLNPSDNPNPSEDGHCTLGDANGDGKIDYQDVGIVKEIVSGTLASNYSVAADLDGDGAVTPSDVVLIKLMAAKRESDPAITDAEKGNCDLPTAVLTYSVNGGTFNTSATVKNGDTLSIKAAFNKDLPDTTWIHLSIDNNLLADVYMVKNSASEFVYNFSVPVGNFNPANVSIYKEYHAFDDNIALTNSTFVIDNSAPTSGLDPNPSLSFGGLMECQAVTYSDWSDCADGTQTRTVLTSSPDGCVLNYAQKASLEQACQMPVLPQVAGVKLYPDGSLLRAEDLKIWVIESGLKRHIKTLQELAAKYFGLPIIKVTLEQLAAYPDAQTN